MSSKQKLYQTLNKLLILLFICSSLSIFISIMITMIDTLLIDYHLNFNRLFYWYMFILNCMILISIIFTRKNLYKIAKESTIQCYLLAIEKLKFYRFFQLLMAIIVAIKVFYLLLQQIFIAYDDGKWIFFLFYKLK